MLMIQYSKKTHFIVVCTYYVYMNFAISLIHISSTHIQMMAENGSFINYTKYLEIVSKKLVQDHTYFNKKMIVDY